MVLSKKIIAGIISIAVASFVILFVIQFFLIKNTIAVNRQEFSTKMVDVRKDIHECFPPGINEWEALAPDSLPQNLFLKNMPLAALENFIRGKVDSVLKANKIFLSYSLSARVGRKCYLHGTPVDLGKNPAIDESDYTICVCSNSRPHSLDMGFSFINLQQHLITNSSGIIILCALVLLLLVGIFAYAMYIIQKQKSLAELKNDFINNLTHEFKTPIFSIGLTSGLLMKSEDIAKSDKLKSYVGLINAENSRLRVQVDKILQMTAIDSGNVMLEKKMLDIHRIIEKNIASFSPIIDESGGKISFNPNAERHTVLGDEVHLFNVISNLIDNAFKYSGEQKAIVISTRNKEHNIIIDVKDNGIGMDKESLHMIFDKFYRVKQGNLHDVKGFGLGLSYVRKIIDMHDGIIEVQSKPGMGTTFSIYLAVQ
jgi:signal transduction histidine kinase